MICLGPRGAGGSDARSFSPDLVSTMTSGGPERKPLAEATDYGRYAGLGFQFAATLLVFGALGWWLDLRLGSGPWLLISGVFLGATGAFIALLRAVGTGGPRRAGASRETGARGREDRDPDDDPPATR
jgi:F0F1-type ATP synthase assembly protein I